MSKLAILPVFNENTQPSYFLKSEYPQVNFSEFNEKRDHDIREKNTFENYSQIYIITAYTISSEESQYFCRFDIISPFEVNKHLKEFTKADFLKALNYHVKENEVYIKGKVLSFPNGLNIPLTYSDLDVDLIADNFLLLYK